MSSQDASRRYTSFQVIDTLAGMGLRVQKARRSPSVADTRPGVFIYYLSKSGVQSTAFVSDDGEYSLKAAADLIRTEQGKTQ